MGFSPVTGIVSNILYLFTEMEIIEVITSTQGKT